MPPPFLFRHADPGAPSLTGQVGSLVQVLSHCLIVGQVLTTPDDSTFTDRTAAARLAGDAAFALFPTPATGDRLYIGHSVPFGRAKFGLVTLGVGGAYTWEYWNGSAWTALTVTDGTSGFTQGGAVTWTPPSDWRTASVNSVTMYWVRVRPTSVPSTAPTCDTLTVVGWIEAFSGTNKRAYRQGAGPQFYLRVQDDGPHGTALGREARTRGFESMTDVDTGTGDFPTSAQLSTGLIIRKSATTDGTARAWVVLCDERTVSLFVLTGDQSGNYHDFHFGEFFSLAGTADAYRCVIIGRDAENNGSQFNNRLDNTTSVGSSNTGHYVARAWTGTGGSLQIGKHTDNAKDAGGNAMAFPNPVDGGIYLGQYWLHEGSVVRGRLRGVYVMLHQNVLSDGIQFSGVGGDAARRFLVVKQSGNSRQFALELSDTWETN